MVHSVEDNCSHEYKLGLVGVPSDARHAWCCSIAAAVENSAVSLGTRQLTPWRYLERDVAISAKQQGCRDETHSDGKPQYEEAWPNVLNYYS